MKFINFYCYYNKKYSFYRGNEQYEEHSRRLRKEVI